MTPFEEYEFPLDDRLEDVVDSIVTRIEDPLRTKLQRPQLRVVKGPCGINSYCMRQPDGKNIILMGADLYSFLVQYTRAAATYFLPSEPQGSRPSPYWLDARAAAAATLDWISSPAPSPLYPEFGLTSHQRRIAQSFADCTYRFALCHEMAHIALEHVDVEPFENRTIGGSDFEVLKLSQHNENQADRFGLELHVRSLDELFTVLGLSSAIYFFHITGLLNTRRMLLNNLVDDDSWKIAHTHPPYLERVVRAAGAADRLYPGSEKGMYVLNNDLTNLDNELWHTALEEQEKIFKAVCCLVDNETVRHGAYSEKADQSTASLVSAPEAVQKLLEHFKKSPLGVLRALEPAESDNSKDDPDAKESTLKSRMLDQFALALPAEFQRFRRLTMVQRSQAIA